ncbi:hypothetical protein EDB92DRAFT_1932167 [Lactarius akahatsu]|uniref:Uncharacterized protein n=1 Tax=Lactarius akahatsu TaxID=416441 RepID=A0AAD4QG26_9AGAM|nr:hypothetical protein EDB92DRAFT_1932167 [Lactarius akahatsu]
MFATLSSFLPSALQSSPNPSNGTSKDAPIVSAEEQPSKLVGVDEVGIKKKERRTNNESFIVVRPPPAKSNHPLNLQVQLVPPQSRDRDRSRSMDVSTSSQEHDGTTLSRTTSNRSDVSMYSAYSSVTSFSSVTSTSTTSSRRMIIPLYNLQAHNVMTNVIVDAGTDAKVAKFQKRGLEVLGLAVLEPVEVFGSHPASLSLFPPSSNRTSIDEHHDLILHAAPRPGGPDGVHTPASSALSLSSGGADPVSPPASTFTRTDKNSTPTNGPKKIFGKIFKKKDNQPPPPSPSPSPSPTNNIFRAARPSTGHHLSSIPASLHLQPAVLGIHPSCSSPSYPPHGRPHSYTWIVRKWIKGSNESLLSNVIGNMNPLSLSEERRYSRPPPEEGAVEVQFIWTRGKKKRRLREGSHQVSTSSHRTNTVSPPKSGSASSLHRSGTVEKRTSAAEKRLSATSGISVSTGSEAGSAAGRGRGDDTGDLSDPEDSETPWTCTLVVSRLGSSSALPARGSPDGSGGSDGAATVRVRVATFSPTPHHPKVVALLKVPFPLPDIIIDRMQVCRRAVSAQGIARPSWNTDPPEGLVLTAEEIKDVVSSTGINIGGVGKVSRKGDGWRIRA